MRRLPPALAALLAGACASVDPSPAFRDVKGRVAAVSGEEPVWIRTAEQQAEIDRSRDRLLAEPLTVESAVRLALVGNPALQAELEELGVSQAELAQAARFSNPEADLSLRFVEGGPGRQTELGLVQDVLDVVLQPARKRIASLQLEQTKARVAGEILALIAEVKQAYYSVVAREQLIGRLALILELTETAAQFAERQHQAGTLAEIDLVQQQALRNESKLDVAVQQAELRADRERLNRLLGLWGARTAWTAPAALPPLPDGEIPLEGLERLAIERRADVQAARLEVELVGRAIALKRGTRFFPLGVHVGVSTEKEPPDGVPGGAGHATRITGPSLALQLPIFDAGGASLAKLEAQHRQAQRRLEALAIGARSEAREARDRLLATRQLAEYYARVLVPQRARILELAVGYFNMMLKGAYEVLLAKAAEVQAEKAGLEAWRDYWTARAQLERALGGALPAAARAEGER